MTYFEERYGVMIDAEPHYDSYFAEEGGPADEVGLPEILLAIMTLSERQRFVIECRYGLRAGCKGQRISVREIGTLMGISFQAVSQLETRALEVLRSTLTKTP